jgi:hypothetical protein
MDNTLSQWLLCLNIRPANQKTVFIGSDSQKWRGIDRVGDLGLVHISTLQRGFDDGKMQVKPNRVGGVPRPRALIPQHCSSFHENIAGARREIRGDVRDAAIRGGHVGIVGPDLPAGNPCGRAGEIGKVRVADDDRAPPISLAGQVAVVRSDNRGYVFRAIRGEDVIASVVVSGAKAIRVSDTDVAGGGHDHGGVSTLGINVDPPLRVSRWVSEPGTDVEHAGGASVGNAGNKKADSKSARDEQYNQGNEDFWDKGGA